MEAYNMTTDIFSRLDSYVVRMEKIPEGAITRVHLQSTPEHSRYGTPRQRTPRMGTPREDHSLQKLGRLLGEEDELAEEEVTPVEQKPIVKEEPAAEVPVEIVEKERVPE